jgi:hypothetical protein
LSSMLPLPMPSVVSNDSATNWSMCADCVARLLTSRF